MRSIALRCARCDAPDDDRDDEHQRVDAGHRRDGAVGVASIIEADDLSSLDPMEQIDPVEQRDGLDHREHDLRCQQDRDRLRETPDRSQRHAHPFRTVVAHAC
ncbi:MAG: hypothetical protein M3O29_07055 [Actinomycetota bacterium]|nr:hypothetical protein [Actinomycetota bacterium]